MPKIAEKLTVGDREAIKLNDLLEIVEDAYSELARAVNQKPTVYVQTNDGDTSLSSASIGDININTSTNNVEILTNHTDSTTVVWTPIS